LGSNISGELLVASMMIDRLILLDAAKFGFNAKRILCLSSLLVVGPLPVIGRCHFRPVTDRLLVVGISGF